MDGKEHLTAGLISGLVITKPTTPEELIITVSFSVIGSLLPDADTLTKKKYKSIIYRPKYMILLIGSIAGIMCTMKNILPMKIFSIIILFGAFTAHRTFLHTIYSLGILTFLLYISCSEVALPFFIGYSSHLLLDSFTPRHVNLLGRKKKRKCRRG